MNHKNKNKSSCKNTTWTTLKQFQSVLRGLQVSNFVFVAHIKTKLNKHKGNR